jgi:uncharacterized protein with von Willebrand factor type A (vWA) domain
VPERAVSTLAAHMRAAGHPVGVGQVLAGWRALGAVDPASPQDAYFALRATLCASRRDLLAFDAAWASTFVVPDGEIDSTLDDMMRTVSAALPRAAVPESRPAPAELAEEPLPAAYAGEELLLHKDFAQYTHAERVAARALLERLAARGPQRRSRRLKPSRRRGEVHDLRATFRAALRYGGELGERRYRSPALRQRPMVLVVDVSGSMQPYARMLLMYTQAAVAARRRVEAYALGTRLTRITRELHGRDPDRALARASERVVDLGGGTRIGAALGELNRVHGRRLGRGSVIVILSDGWDRGQPEELGAEMARLRRSAHRLVWLNPLAANPAYEPLTRGMLAALPHTDHLLPGNSIASLEALAELMETIS